MASSLFPIVETQERSTDIGALRRGTAE